MPSSAQQRAAELVAEFEGFSAKPYLDKLADPPVWTIGFGSTRLADGSRVTEHTAPLTRQQAIDLMAHWIGCGEATITRLVWVPINTNQRAALLSLVYNIGPGAFASSTLLRKLQARDYLGAANEFPRWNMSGGVIRAGLVRRRKAERTLFLTSGA